MSLLYDFQSAAVDQLLIAFLSRLERIRTGHSVSFFRVSSTKTAMKALSAFCQPADKVRQIMWLVCKKLSRSLRFTILESDIRLLRSVLSLESKLSKSKAYVCALANNVFAKYEIHMQALRRLGIPLKCTRPSRTTHCAHSV